MASRLKDINRIFYLLLLLAVVLIGALISLAPGQVQAEGNPPTITPTITLTVAPPPTLEPVDTPVEDNTDVEAKGVEVDQTGGDETQGNTPPDDNAAPISNSPTGGLFGANLCLIGAIVVAATIVMFMVVYGVIQRVRS
jgi:hypothetical protein